MDRKEAESKRASVGWSTAQGLHVAPPPPYTIFLEVNPPAVAADGAASIHGCALSSSCSYDCASEALSWISVIHCSICSSQIQQAGKPSSYTFPQQMLSKRVTRCYHNRQHPPPPPSCQINTSVLNSKRVKSSLLLHSERELQV